ncbi:ARL14 effector protein-like [Limulus polyphemus]|uniref:ARL14 effector protein-like n=1 Tax=Limulus polyphemus TaxID=6850 RepID=A0ABM1BEF9_LIMPO|nr:ARL14 effector protein-like [Limulus polyphemus]
MADDNGVIVIDITTTSGTTNVSGNDSKQKTATGKDKVARNNEESTERPAYRDKRLRQLRKETKGQASKFLENWNPETSNRETRKMTRKIYNEKSRGPQVHDERGTYVSLGKNLCDCLEETCPGCHYPCPKCKSPKCGHECRQNRKWIYEQLEIEGTDKVIKHISKTRNE